MTKSRIESKEICSHPGRDQDVKVQSRYDV